MARPVPSARPGWGWRAGARRQGALAGTVMMLTFASFSAPSPAAAAGNELYDARVTPHDGTIATSFQFTVKYTSSPNRQALSVEAQVAGLTVPLALISGTETDGKWRGFSLLPAGDDWPVTFVADAESGADPTISGPSLVVTAPPPTPQPTPPPTPPSTPIATPSASTASSPTGPPGGSPPSQPTPAPSPVVLPPAATPTIADSLAPGVTSSATPVWGAFGGGAIEQASASAAAVLVPRDTPPRRVTTGGIGALPIISGGLVAFGLLGIAGVLAVQRDRRRRWLHDRLARAVPSDKPERPPPRWAPRA